MPVKFAKNCIFVLDGRVLARDLVLAQGRHAYAIGSSAGAMIFAALSEPADRLIGTVAKAEGPTLTLTVAIGPDTTEVPVTLAADAVGAGEAGVGKSVRILPARPLTVLAFSADKVGIVPADTPEVAWGLLADAGAETALALLKDGAYAKMVSTEKKRSVLVDVTGFPGHGPAPALAPGMPAAFLSFWKRPGTKNCYLVAQAVDAGRRDGVVKAVDGTRLTLTVLGAAAAQDETIDATAATVRLDGAGATLADLKPGASVSVFAARPQTVLAQAAPPAAAPH